VDTNERVVSVAAGSILTLLGASRRDVPGLLIATVGAGLVCRGATGHCAVYERLGVSSASPSQRRSGIHVEQSILVDKSVHELYEYWHNLENLPRIMSNLKSVRALDDRRSHWVASAPSIVGGQVEWDAETVADVPDSQISWQSLPGSEVSHSGSVEFKRAPGDRGTAIRVVMDYRPPAGQVGRLIARLFGDDADQQIREDLRRFKRTMELGEVPTIEGQPHGTCMGRGIRSF